MSYNVSIARNNISKDDKVAWEQLSELFENESLYSEQGSDFLNLIEKLKLKYPCICELPDEKIDDGVWSDGPLSNNAGKDLATLGIVYSQVDNVMPFLIKTATECGFVVFDSQTGIISRPKVEPNSFWSKLFLM